MHSSIFMIHLSKLMIVASASAFAVLPHSHHETTLFSRLPFNVIREKQTPSVENEPFCVYFNKGTMLWSASNNDDDRDNLSEMAKGSHNSTAAFAEKKHASRGVGKLNEKKRDENYLFIEVDHIFKSFDHYIQSNDPISQVLRTKEVNNLLQGYGRIDRTHEKWPDVLSSTIESAKLVKNYLEFYLGEKSSLEFTQDWQRAFISLDVIKSLKISFLREDLDQDFKEAIEYLITLMEEEKKGIDFESLLEKLYILSDRGGCTSEHWQ